MNIFKTIWQFVRGKNVITQQFIPQEQIKLFAQKLDDLIRFDKVFGGKFAFLERYDAWAIEQIITAFLALVGAKVGLKAINLVEGAIKGFNSGNYAMAKKSGTEFLASVGNFKKVDNNVENIVYANQVSMLFDLMNYTIEKELTV